MVDKTPFIWMDGDLVNWDDAKIHVLSHTLHYGYGAFEGIRAYKLSDGSSGVFRLRAHMQRLLDSAKLLQLTLPYSVDDLDDAAIETLKANKLEVAYIRPIVYLGDREVGVYPGDTPDVHVSIITWKWGAYLGADALTKGIGVKFSTFNKYHINSFLVNGKVNGHYVNSVLAKIEAVRDGYAEALLLDHNGYLAEGTGENIFVVRNGVVFTPGEDATILKGITRASVIQVIRDLGYKVVERRLTRNDVYLADELFFSGTAAEVTPITSVDRRTIGSGKPGPVTKALQEAFFRIIRGEDERYRGWLTTYTP